MITINGKSYKGNSVSMINGRIIIDGKDVTDEDTTEKNLVINCGDNVTIEHFECGDGLVINGNLHGDILCHGSARTGDIFGNVKAGGSVSCEHVDGDVSAGGSVSCENVGGSVSAGGSISKS